MHSVNCLLPFLLRILRSIDLRLSLGAHLLYHIGDPVTLWLHDGWSVSVRGWRMRTVRVEHVWELVNSQTKVGKRTTITRPFLVQLFAIDACKVYLHEAAGQRVEAGCDGDNVEVMMSAVFGYDAILCYM